MSDYRQYLTETLDHYKCKSKSDYLVSLPVFDDGEEIVAYLRPITADFRTTMPNIAALMGQWRKENPSISMSVFEITEERTLRWIDNLLVNNDNRIVFAVTDFEGAYLGHIGLASFDPERYSGEIDSVLRGVKKVLPRLMEYSMRTMIAWGKQVLRLKEITLQTAYDNLHARAFYRRCGFVETERIPLKKVVLPDEVKWVAEEDPAVTEAERYSQVMVYQEA